MIWNDPSASHGCFGLPGLFGSTTRARMRAMATIGTLMRKTEPHQKYSSRKPPSTGPMAAPPEAIAAQTPIASARSRSSVKVSRMIESVAGIIRAAPRARNTRPAMRTDGFGA
ncbi:hypothetical protein D9M72_490660 [compost metagenome]